MLKFSDTTGEIKNLTLPPGFLGSSSSAQVCISIESENRLAILTAMGSSDSKFACSSLWNEISGNEPIELTISHSTRRWEPREGFKHLPRRSFVDSDFLVVTILDGSATLKLPVECTLHVPSLRVDLDTVIFPECEYGGYRTAELVFYNDSDISLDYAIEPTSPFRFDFCSSGIVGPASSKSITVKFIPTRLGPVTAEVKVKYCENMYEMCLKFHGYCVSGMSKVVKPERGLLAIEDRVLECVTGVKRGNVLGKKKASSMNPFKDFESGLVAPNMSISEFLESTDQDEGRYIFRSRGGRDDKSPPVRGIEIEEPDLITAGPEMRLVQVDPQVLEFGTVYMGESKCMHFGLRNGTSKSLLIETIAISSSNSESVGCCSPDRVIADAGSEFVFEIKVEPKRSRGEEMISFILLKVDGTISKKVTLKFKAEPRRIEFSNRSLTFKFDSNNVSSSQECAQFIDMTNPCACPVSFSWKSRGESNYFNLKNPSDGTIAPFSVFRAEFIYRPSPGVPKSEEEYVCEIQHGEESTSVIKLLGVCPITHCQVIPSVIDFGKFCLGETNLVRTFRIQNTGNATLYFHLDLAGLEQDSASRIYLPCNHGRLLPNETSAELSVILLSGGPRWIPPEKEDDDQAGIIVRHGAGKPVRVRIKGEAGIPRITIKGSLGELNFEKIPLMTFSTLFFTLENQSPFPATNLSLEIPCPEFSSTNTNLSIPPESELRIGITYKPTSIKIHDFSLPISVGGCEVATLQIQAQAVPPLLTVDPAVLDLGHIKVKNTSDRLFFISVSSAGVEDWDIDESDLPEYISAKRSSCPSSSNICVQVHPTQAIPKIEAFLHLTVEGKQRYLSIPILGRACEARLTCAEERIAMPPAKQGQESKFFLTLMNDGFDNPEITAAGFDSPFLTVSVPPFVEGESQTVAEITLFSLRPVSVISTLKIQYPSGFLTLPVRGIVDSSPLTFPVEITTADRLYILRYFNLSSVPSDWRQIRDILELMGEGFLRWCVKNGRRRTRMIVTETGEDLRRNIVNFLLTRGAILDFDAGELVLQALCQIVKLFDRNVNKVSIFSQQVALMQNKVPYIDAFASPQDSVQACFQELGFHPLPPGPPSSPRAEYLLALIMEDCLEQLEPLAIELDFQTSLALPIEKRVKLWLPDATASSYAPPKIYGSSEFFLREDDIIDQEGSVNICFQPKFFSEKTSVNGYLHLVPVQKAASRRGPVIVKLKGTCTGPDPVLIVPVRVEHFKKQSVEISVTNPFPQDASFKVSLSPASENVLMNPDPSVLLITGRGSGKVALTVIGIEKKISTLRFLDEQVGEFFVGIDLLVSPAPFPLIPCLRLCAEANTFVTEKFQVPLEQGATIERVFLLNPKNKFFELNYPKIVFKPAQVGIYTTYVSVEYKCVEHDNRLFTRKFLIEGTSFCTPLAVHMRMETFARESIVQRIPIRNPRDRACEFFVQLLNNENTGSLSLLESEDGAVISVAPNSVQYVTLQFRPAWITTSTSSEPSVLIFDNKTTFERIEISIEAIAKEPLSEYHKISINCVARELRTFQIPVKCSENHMVETDLEDVFGDSSVVGQHDEVYSLQVRASCARKVVGSVTFRNVRTNEYFWHLIELISSPPANTAVLDLSAKLFETSSLEIELLNPTDTSAHFLTAIHGKYLSGNHEFTIPGKSLYLYSLSFCPWKPGSFEGSIAFSSAQLGDVWYVLKLCAVPTPPIGLGTVSCELGRSERIFYSIRNPTNHEITFTSRTHPHFSPIDTTVAIPAKDSVKTSLEFTPSSVGTTRETTIAWVSRDPVDQEQIEVSYTVIGEGLIPENPMQIFFTAELNFERKTNISFFNPFFEQTNFTLETTLHAASPQTFLAVNARETINIPLTLTPTSTSPIAAEITVSAKGFLWKYMINCSVELPLDKSLVYAFSSQARVPARSMQSVVLHGLRNVDAKLMASVEVVGKQHRRILESSVVMEPLETAREITDDGLKILVQTDLNAFKPFTNTSSLLIVSDGISRWKFQTKFLVTPPPLDDEITIETPQLDSSGYVSFPLTNIFDSFDPFEASIVDGPAPRSSIALFSVSPASGVMGPSKSGPTHFTVSFKPREYGRISSTCKLIIQTELVYWSFLLKGSLPTYTPPTKIHSRLRL